MPWLEENLNEEFKQKILDFSNEKLPIIYKLLEIYRDKKNVIIFKTREEASEYLENIKGQKYTKK